MRAASTLWLWRRLNVVSLLSLLQSPNGHTPIRGDAKSNFSTRSWQHEAGIGNEKYGVSWIVYVPSLLLAFMAAMFLLAAGSNPAGEVIAALGALAAISNFGRWEMAKPERSVERRSSNDFKFTKTMPAL